jgi:hypothetical protein
MYFFSTIQLADFPDTLQGLKLHGLHIHIHILAVVVLVGMDDVYTTALLEYFNQQLEEILQETRKNLGILSF